MASGAMYRCPRWTVTSIMEGRGRCVPSANMMGDRDRERQGMMARVYGGATSTGISLGSAIAVTVSWSLYHSLIWAIVHGIFGWFYVIYFALTRK